MKHRASSEIPRHRKDAVTFSSVAEARARMLKEPLCGYCRKLLHRTTADARNYIGLLLHTTLRKRCEYTLQPYRCPRKPGWHIGRNIKTVELFRKGIKR
jgi:hypothetical protein